MRLVVGLSIAAATILGLGAGIAGATFDVDDPWFYVGLSTYVAGIVGAFLVPLANRRMHTDDAFESGYNAGYRKGRRVGSPQVVWPLKQEDRSGRIPKTPLRTVAGDSPTPGWPEAHEN